MRNNKGSNILENASQRSGGSASNRRPSVRSHIDPKTGRLRRCSRERNLQLDIKDILASRGKERARRGGQVGNHTLFLRKKCFRRCVKRLHKLGYKIRTLENLRSDHIRALVDDFRDRKRAPATVSTYLSHLRRLCEWLGKPQLVDVINGLVAADPSLVARPSVATRDLSLTGAGLDVHEVLTEAMKIDARFTCILALMWALALRTREAMEFHPHMAEAEDGTLVIDHGTKGGRPRKLPNILLGDKERAIIAWARGMQPAHGGRMVPEGISSETYMRKFYRFTAKIGLTRKHLGRTPHALRHERLQLIFEWLTGHPPPIRGGALAATDPASDRAARRIVAEYAGHGRIHASSAYLGSMRPGHPRGHGSDAPQEQSDAGAAQQSLSSSIHYDSSEQKTEH